MKKNKHLLLVMGLLLLGFLVKANDGKSEAPLIHGYVTDAITKKPVSGVVVSAVLAGTNNSKEVMTDADGYFHFTQLPSNQVNLQFDKKGYQSYKRASVMIKEKSAVRVNVDFFPEDTENKDDDSEYPMLRILQLH